MQKENLSQRTAETLQKMILKEHIYKYGEKLPNENELSAKLGISRTTLREAIRILASDGLLEVRRGLGTFVAQPLNQYAEGSIDFQEFSKLKITLRDLYETRMIFEPEAAALASRRATEDEIKEILRLGDICQRELLRDPQGKRRIDSEAAFHGAILKASHNDFLSRFMPILTETIEQTFALNFNLDMIAEQAYKDHILIMDFLEKRDAVALKSAVTIHLHHALLTEQISLKENEKKY